LGELFDSQRTVGLKFDRRILGPAQQFLGSFLLGRNIDDPNIMTNPNNKDPNDTHDDNEKK
jgi:hypothetical protein